MPWPPVVVDAEVLIRNVEYCASRFLEVERGHWTLGYHVAEL